ncbi:ABC transporter substrate-binding protein [Aerococcaceae bacterium WGS1372]
MKNTLRKMIQSVLALSTLLTVSPLTAQAQEVEREPISIGILQFNEHGSLEENRLGFIDGMSELGYIEGENLTINYVNAAAEVSQLPSLAESIVKESDYLFAIATPAAQALANATQDKVVMFSSVADPIGAGVVNSLEEPGKNLTGTTNIGPIEKQIKEVLLPLIPDAKKIGLIYNSSEINAQYQVDIAIPIIEGEGLEAVVRTISSTNDISASMNALVNEGVDGIYLVTDNYIASSMALVGEIGKEAGIPLVGGSNDMIEENGLATYGLDYYELGVQTAEMLVRIIDEDLDPATVPVEMANHLELVVNEDYASAIGIEPQAIYDLIKE